VLEGLGLRLGFLLLTAAFNPRGRTGSYLFAVILFSKVDLVYLRPDNQMCAIYVPGIKIELLSMRPFHPRMTERPQMGQVLGRCRDSFSTLQAGGK